METFRARIDAELPEMAMTKARFEQALIYLEEENKVLVVDDTVYRV